MNRRVLLWSNLFAALTVTRLAPSMVARLAPFMVALLALRAAAAPLLSIDFNQREGDAALMTQPGFASFVITSNTSPTSPQTNATIVMIGTNRVTLYGFGRNKNYTDMGARPVPTNYGGFTDSLLLRDCVYSLDVSNGGLAVLVENLPASMRVQATIWSFDCLAVPYRVSDWYANGVLARGGYGFKSDVMPTNNEQYRFSFACTVDGLGQLAIEGRRNGLSTNSAGSRQPAVFLNALRIEPALEIVSLQPSGNELRLTFSVWPQPGDYLVEESVNNQWRGLIGASYSGVTNNRVVARFARPNGTRWYRVRYAY